MFPRGPLLIPKLSRPPELTWRVPGSKSITSRALVLAALAEGESTLEGGLDSGGVRPPKQPLFVGNSGTTVRFLTALACLVPGSVTLVGDEAMARRPIQDLVDG